jgi:mannose-6-phosphate isomerase-like protein (cupin superfamily)
MERNRLEAHRLEAGYVRAHRSWDAFPIQNHRRKPRIPRLYPPPMATVLSSHFLGGAVGAGLPYRPPRKVSGFRSGLERRRSLSRRESRPHSICSLSPNGISVPVRHRTVEEIWYVLSGGGQISRRHGDLEPWIDDLAAGTCVDIGLGITFQFRAADAGVEIAILTIPSWPGSGEAVTEPERGTWQLP